MKKLTQEEFLQKAKKANPLLLFDKAVYLNSQSKVIVTCPKHGDFEVTVQVLFRGVTCPKCKLEDRKNKFIQKAKIIHKDKYDYSKVEYKTNKIPVEIICPIHGSFWQAPGDHLKGYGCAKCSKKYKPTTEEWVAHMEKLKPEYDYSKVIYKDNKTKVLITCKKHNKSFYVIPNNFIHDMFSCPECIKEYRQSIYSKPVDLFIQEASKIHFHKYDYSKVKYINNKTPVTIICPEHGEFEQTPATHLSGSGCPKCKNKSLTLLFELLKKNFVDELIEYEYAPKWLSPYRFDIYFPKYNIAVEYDGVQHFVPIKWFGGELTLQKTRERDKLKKLKCIKNNCTLFRLKYNYTEEDFINIVLQIRKIINSTI